jgi:hypothetical protein
VNPQVAKILSIQQDKRATRLSQVAADQQSYAQSIKPTFYDGFDIVSGQSLSTVIGGSSSNRVTIITQNSINAGEKVALRPSQGADRIDSISTDPINPPKKKGAPLKAILLQGGIKKIDEDFLINSTYPNGSFTWRRRMAGDFKLEFKFRAFGADGLCASLTTVRDLNPAALYQTYGFKPFPNNEVSFPTQQLVVDYGELIFAVDTLSNDPLAPGEFGGDFSFPRARVFIYQYKDVPSQILLPFDDPNYLDASAIRSMMTLVGSPYEDEYRECIVSAIGGVARFQIASGNGFDGVFPEVDISVNLLPPEPPILPESAKTVYYQDKYLRLSASNGIGEQNIFFKDVKLTRLS